MLLSNKLEDNGGHVNSSSKVAARALKHLSKWEANPCVVNIYRLIQYCRTMNQPGISKCTVFWSYKRCLNACLRVQVGVLLNAYECIVHWTGLKKQGCHLRQSRETYVCTSSRVWCCMFGIEAWRRDTTDTVLVICATASKITVTRYKKTIGKETLSVHSYSSY